LCGGSNPPKRVPPRSGSGIDSQGQPSSSTDPRSSSASSCRGRIGTADRFGRANRLVPHVRIISALLTFEWVANRLDDASLSDGELISVAPAVPPGSLRRKQGAHQGWSRWPSAATTMGEEGRVRGPNADWLARKKIGIDRNFLWRNGCLLRELRATISRSFEERS
jgi:hypothetical protein